MDHIRIDEGLPRKVKPRNQSKAARRRSFLPACNSKLEHLDATKVIDRYLQDETTKDIAQSLGVHRSGLHQWLLRNCESQWHEAQIARALTSLEEAKEGLKTADDALSLSRAREELRGAQWELERLFSRLYGDKQEVTVKTQPVLTINTSSQVGNVAALEGESTRIPDSDPSTNV